MKIITWMTTVLLVAGMALPRLEASPKEWEELKGQNFIIYYRSQVTMDFVQTTMDSAEQEFQRVTQSLGISRYQGWHWDKRAVIYIYRDSDDYTKNGGARWSHGSALTQQKVIKTYPSAQGFFDSLLPHELGHIIFREFIGFLAVVPLWFEEGVAMYQEKAKRWGANQDVRTAIQNGQFITLTDLTNMPLYNDSDQKTVDLFYAEAASAVYFLITEFGDQKFFYLLKELKQNTSFETALKKNYMQIKDLSSFDKQWKRYLEDGS